MVFFDLNIHNIQTMEFEEFFKLLKRENFRKNWQKFVKIKNDQSFYAVNELDF